MRITGIYKITNLSNQKFYIGQSRDIHTRWKAHTMSLRDGCNESVMRMAFAKYGLREQVSKSGIYGNFNFEIIELCAEEELVEREHFHIKNLQPKYNVQLMGVNSIFPKRDTLKAQNFVQYHSFDKMGYLPGESDDDSIMTDENNYGIFTKKRVAINMLGSSIVLIVGGKPANCKYNRYYLWSEMVVEDIQFDEINKNYIVQGVENLQSEPIDITDLNGFANFKMQCGNFAFGLSSMLDKPFFYDEIIPLVKKNKIKQPMSYNKWIDDFIERQDQLFQAKSAI
jgi:GIY-YIG catalytic domain